MKTRSRPAAPRSYLGIGACVLWLIATSMVAAFFVANNDAQHKMAGLEGVIVFPGAFVLHVVGIFMSNAAMKAREQNPLARTGTVLNVLPLVVFLIAIVLKNS